MDSWNEAKTRLELIDPALRESGWGVVDRSKINPEEICPGRILGGGRRAKSEIADYVLVYHGKKVAVVEAKKYSLEDTEGLGQAKRYAEKLKSRFAYSTNGRRIYEVDMETGKEEYVDGYPSPDELWNRLFEKENRWRDRFSSVPFEDRGGQWQPRYYQHNAIEAALEAISSGRDRILLTLATGTGKTAIAFQIAWKLFHARWNLSERNQTEEPTRRPRILFLADRNILADQAYNSFSAFAEDARARVDPAEIRKKGRVPKNASIFFTIFQTFMTGRDEDGKPAPYFGDYPEDFFDLIIIDECHRGGASEESSWRDLMEHFSPAVQIGLTATPKRKDNVDTYAYFGEPVYVYSLKEGINDGFLTPFKVKQIATTLDDYVYTADDEVLDGEPEEGKRYAESDFNRIIEIEGRERKRVEIFMEQIDQSQKSLVFCATQAHAAAVRNLINQIKTSKNPNYCARVTANDGKEGERILRVFQDNEKTIPTILTTSFKLSTGVDARNIRNIVLMRPINDMIEFKQIIGRGTRLYDGKDCFTVYDFVRAYEHFEDPEWDGEPMEPPETISDGNTTDQIYDVPDDDNPEPDGVEDGSTEWEDEGEPTRPRKIKIKLADGKERQIQHMQVTTFWSADGKPMSAHQFIETLFGELPDLFKNEDELRTLWSNPETRKSLMDGLAEKGFGGEQLDEIRKLVDAEKSDVYDVLANIAYATIPITREERVAKTQEQTLTPYDKNVREFLEFVLGQYVSEGVGELDTDKLSELLELKYKSTVAGTERLGGVQKVRDAFIGFQAGLYRD
ncbi:MAG: DEAD/DEAH box helicase [Nitrospirales bacterium]|nr:MAG: DEAD/DEAH box helicase [Nitrospirales bacterium]